MICLSHVRCPSTKARLIFNGGFALAGNDVVEGIPAQVLRVSKAHVRFPSQRRGKGLFLHVVSQE